jgi:serine/threonine protein kinase
MVATEFHIPTGAILFSEGGVSYEFRRDLGEANHGLSLFLARKRTAEGPGGRVLLKAVGLPSGRAGARAFKARSKLEEETKIASVLDHPGILRVFGMHKGEGAWYIIAEHPEANPLNDLLTLVMEGEGYFSAPFVLYVGAQVADILDHAHTRTDQSGRPLGIVHRAINPETIFMDWRGGVKVADFGLALSTLPGRVVSTVRRPQGLQARCPLGSVLARTGDTGTRHRKEPALRPRGCAAGGQGDALPQQARALRASDQARQESGMSRRGGKHDLAGCDLYARGS